MVASTGSQPGMVATLIAEIGDIRRFSDFDKLVAYIGVHPAERSSGDKGRDPETSWHMAKTGNAYLRTALYRMALVGITHNPTIRAHYAHKRAQGKSKMKRGRPLHEEGAGDRLGRLAERRGLRRSADERLTSPYGS